MEAGEAGKDTMDEIDEQIKKFASPEKAKANALFFKTGKGEYGEGDKFAGLTVPQCRIIVQKNRDLPLIKISKLLKSEIHEKRMIALLILIEKFQKSQDRGKSEIYKFYLKNTKYINNWDLVDLSAPKIVGEYLLNKNRTPLFKLAKSKSLWEKRISILATFQFICVNRQFKDTLKIAEILLNDSHDLIQKAVGWMLREIGKRASEKALVNFLDKNAPKMPRTMLRYAIERFPEKTRRYYLKKV